MRALSRGKAPLHLPAKALLAPRDIWERKRYANSNSPVWLEAGAWGCGADLRNQNMPEQGSEPGGHCRLGKACGCIGFTNPQVTSVVSGRIQVRSDPQSHAFQGTRKGLKFFFFLAFLLSAISTSLWKGKLQTGFHCWAL